MFIVFVYFYNFRLFSIYYLSFFKKRQGQRARRCRGKCNEPCLHPPKALVGFRRMTAVAV